MPLPALNLRHLSQRKRLVPALVCGVASNSSRLRPSVFIANRTASPDQRIQRRNRCLNPPNDCRPFATKEPRFEAERRRISYNFNIKPCFLALSRDCINPVRSSKAPRHSRPRWRIPWVGIIAVAFHSPYDVPAMVHADRRPMLQIESLFMP